MRSDAVDPSLTISEQLRGGERLLWVGRPAAGILLRNEDWLPLAAVVLSAVILLVGYIAGTDFALFDMLAVVLVAAAGLSFIAKLCVDALLRRSTIYGVTDMRALMVTERPRRSVRHIPLRRVAHLAITEVSSRHQTVLLGVAAPAPDWRAGYLLPGLEIFRAPSFEFIEDGWQVYDMLKRLLDEGEPNEQTPAA